MEKLIKKFIFFILPITFSLLILSAHSAFGCLPPLLGQEDPWFKTQVSISQNTVPSGIEINTELLANKNSEPFYLIGENVYIEKSPNSELPPNYPPLFKITAGRVYSWQAFTENNLKVWKWGETGQSALLLGEQFYLDRSEGGSKQVYADNRPANVQIPKPQNFRILGFYKGAPVELRGTIQYFLNDKYDPHAGTPVDQAYQDCVNGFSSRPLSTTIGNIIITIFLIAIIVIIWGGIKWMRSGGDKAKVKSARHTIIGGIIGLILIFLAYFVISIVANLFGII